MDVVIIFMCYMLLNFSGKLNSRQHVGIIKEDTRYFVLSCSEQVGRVCLEYDSCKGYDYERRQVPRHLSTLRFCFVARWVHISQNLRSYVSRVMMCTPQSSLWVLNIVSEQKMNLIEIKAGRCSRCAINHINSLSVLYGSKVTLLDWVSKKRRHLIPGIISWAPFFRVFSDAHATA